MKIKYCKNCKKEFKTFISQNHKYCSKKCYYLSLFKLKIIIKCKVCKITFEVIPSKKEQKYCSFKCYQKYNRGRNHCNYKFGLSHCIDCGKELKDYTSHRCKKCQSLIMKKIRIGHNNPAFKNGFYCRNKKCINCGNPCSSGAIRCKSCNEHLNKLGKKNPQFIHGKGHLPYTKDFPKIRLNILKRDNCKCYLCHKQGNTVHHIDYCTQNNQQSNLITLCLECNLKVNNNRDYWFAYFTYIMEG